MPLIAACATDDGKTLVNRHFGDALRYDLYKVEPDSYVFIRTIENTKRDDDEHTENGSQKKAGGIGKLLKAYNVDVMLAKKIGQNITRMRKAFVPVISRDPDIDSALASLTRIHDVILREMNTDTHFVLRNSGSPS